MTKREDLPSLDRLGKDIRRLHDKVMPKPKPPRQSGFALAAQVGVELASGAFVGGMSGYFLDKWLGTSPVLFILCFFLGSAGGFLTLIRSLKVEDNTGTKKEKTDRDGSN